MIFRDLGGAAATAILFAIFSVILMLCIWWTHKYHSGR